MLTKHSPTPWHTHNRITNWSIGVKEKYSYRDTIADLPQWSGATGHGSKEETGANAAFIVRCCNNYEYALSLLNETLTEIKSDDVRHRIRAFLQENKQG